MISPPSDHDLLEALKWQIEAGADEAIGNQPVDRTAARAKPAPASKARSTPAPVAAQGGLNEAPAKTAPRPPASLVSANQAQVSAQRLAAAAKTIEDIRGALKVSKAAP